MIRFGDETLDEVVEYLRHGTRIDGDHPRNFVVLMVGGSDELEDEIRAAVLKFFGEAST